MMQSAVDQTGSLELAQVYRCLNSNDSSNEIVENICLLRATNKYQLTSLEAKQLHSKIEFTGNTVLHFAAVDDTKSRVLSFLCNYNSNLIVKNQAGLTPLHNLFQEATGNYFLRQQFLDKNKDKVRLLLGTHIKFNNFSNPLDHNGMSHFHIACMFNVVAVIEFFLKNGISIDHAVNSRDVIFAGYTPLHFSACYCQLEATEVLLKHGANICRKDVKGMTALHTLIKLKMDIYNLINTSTKDNDINALMNKIERIERMINLMLEKNTSSDTAFFESMDLSRFHIACTVEDSSQVERLLENNTDIYHPVHEDSLAWPGYTALHFAAHCNPETVKILMMRGADIETKDANGVTPFDIFVKNQKLQDLCAIMSYKLEWKHIQFLNSKTKLLDLLSAMADIKKLGDFLKNMDDINVSIPCNAPLWQGYTPLHLAVVFSERLTSADKGSTSRYPLIEECMNNSADVTIPDAKGSTPLHMAFVSKKKRVVERLLQFHDKIANPAVDGLSHFLIACAMGNIEVVKQFAHVGNVDIQYYSQAICDYFQHMRCGFTPLHVAVANYHIEVAKILMQNSASVNRPNANQETPVHLALFNLSQIGRELLNSQDLKNGKILATNFCHLHVACRFNHLDAARRLIELGANVNAAITFDEERNADISIRISHSYVLKILYQGWTPLHFAAYVGAFEIAKLLIEEGADVLSIAYHNEKIFSSPLSIALDCKKENRNILISNLIVETIKKDESLQKRMEDEFGITMLHLACYDIDLIAVKKFVLKQKARVNARVFKESAIWPDCTPLHVLTMAKIEFSSSQKTLGKNANEIAKFLVNKGSDVTLANSDGNTPIHLSFELYKVSYKETTVRYRTQIQIPEHSLVKMLMKSHRNFRDNPINSEGISHFHIAVAIDDLDVARNFLEHEVDVNLATSGFIDCAAGYTPLHYAVDILSHKTFHGSPDYSMVKLLLEHKADPNAQDVSGNTPFHLATRAIAPRDDLLKLLVKYGANVHQKNLCLQTPIELMIQ